MLRLALVCDLLEERWTSMDLVGDMLFEQFSEAHRERIHVDRIRPALRARLTLLPSVGRSHVAWNADRLLNRMIDYPRLLRRRASGYDIYHIVDHTYAQLAHETPSERTVVTCHDLDAFRCLTQPKADPRPPWFRAMARRILNGLQRAAHVICGSDSVKKAALDLGLLDGGKVSVIYNGIHPSCRLAPDPVADAKAGELLGIPSDVPLLLSVGSTIARKRIDLLLRIFAAVRRQIPAAKLARVGGPFTTEQTKLAAELGILDGILELPFLERDVLAAVYRRSTLLLLTSEAEGFGLPLVEAMACGCPVIASDIPVLREIAGPAALFRPVGDVSFWAETAARLCAEKLSDPEPWMLRTSAAVERANRYSWARTANQTSEVYQKVLGK